MVKANPTPDSEAQSPDPEFDQGRLVFLKAAGAFAAVVALGGLLEACERAGLVTPQASPASPTFTPTSIPGPVSPTPVPTAIATPTATATATPSPTATPNPTSTPTPTATPLLRSERARIAHLLRRVGFGASREELDQYEGMGLSGAIDYLLDYEQVDDSALDTKLQTLNLDLTKIDDLQRWWIVRMVYSKRPLREKMALFWHGLLTSGVSRVGRADYMLKQNEFFREQALGSFPVLLKAVSRDPAMLIWLDSQNNKKSAPNENFARELMELFSMGVGNYTEQDVRESARAFTGWFLSSTGFTFNAAQHDDGVKRFLGESGPFTGDDIIDSIVRQPATADYICRKLLQFFAYDPPDPGLLAALRTTFVASGFSIKAVMRSLLTSETFYASAAYRSRIKSPTEFVAGTLRTLGMATDGSTLPALLTRMGQTLFDPPNVAGWPGGPRWITSVTLLERINFANLIATNRKTFDPRGIVGKASPTPREVLDYLLDHLLDGNVAPSERAIMNAYADDATRVATPDAAARAVAYLVLGSPDFQLA